MTSSKSQESSCHFQSKATMKHFFILLLLFWDNVEFTLTNKDRRCTKPSYINAEIAEHNQKDEYEQDDIVQFRCVYNLTLTFYVNCKYGNWRGPTETCVAITCKLSSDPPQGTTYRPLNQIIFIPGQKVIVSCGEKQWVKSKELQSAELTCQDTGDWDYDPVCQLVTCSRNAENVYEWQRNEYEPDTVYIDQTLWYRCHQGYEVTSPTGRAMCTRGGWEPNPLCKDRRCTKPSFRNADITDHYEKDKYEHNDRVHFRCTYDPRVTFYVDCYYGNWRGSIQTCREKPCTAQPQMVNGEMVDNAKGEYDHGESVEFRCTGETDNFRVTCEFGEWKTQKSCHG